MTHSITFANYPGVKRIQALHLAYRQAKVIEKQVTPVRGEDERISGATIVEQPPQHARLAGLRAELRTHIAGLRVKSMDEWLAATVAALEFAEDAAIDDRAFARDAALLREQLRRQNIEISELAPSRPAGLLGPGSTLSQEPIVYAEPSDRPTARAGSLRALAPRAFDKKLSVEDRQRSLSALRSHKHPGTDEWHAHEDLGLTHEHKR